MEFIFTAHFLTVSIDQKYHEDEEMLKIVRLKLTVLVVTLILINPLNAAPRVVVSLPELHSLVAALMQGTAGPILLFQSESDMAGDLDPFQTSGLLSADLVIWVGSGLEKSVGYALDKFPPIADHFMTLSNTLPLLLKRGYEEIGDQRQISRDLHFWSDPRIAIMAVKQITPLLVRIDPDNTERYLDNEIALLKRIKKVEQEISKQLAPIGAVSSKIANTFDPYFIHRFIREIKPDGSSNEGLQKVSNHPLKTCRQGEITSPSPGPDLYFQTLLTHAKHLDQCVNSRHRIKNRVEVRHNRYQRS